MDHVSLQAITCTGIDNKKQQQKNQTKKNKSLNKLTHSPKLEHYWQYVQSVTVAVLRLLLCLLVSICHLWLGVCVAVCKVTLH